MPQQRKFFPGWLVVASGFVIMATCYTVFVNCVPLFRPRIVRGRLFCAKNGKCWTAYTKNGGFAGKTAQFLLWFFIAKGCNF